jgi:CRP-like cAMP-binding protein
MAQPSPSSLRRVPLFAGLDDRELETLAQSFRDRRFEAGETVAREGDSAVGFFVVEDGVATVRVRGEEVGRLGPGDHFGEIALIDQGARSATVTAETPLRVWGMTFWDFRPIVEGNARLAWKLLQQLARRLREAEARQA